MNAPLEKSLLDTLKAPHFPIYMDYSATTPIDPDDANGFAAAMQRMLQDKPSEPVARGLEQASRYSWTACAAAARRAYQSAIDVHRRDSRPGGQVHARRH